MGRQTKGWWFRFLHGGLLQRFRHPVSFGFALSCPHRARTALCFVPCSLLRRIANPCVAQSNARALSRSTRRLFVAQQHSWHALSSHDACMMPSSRQCANMGRCTNTHPVSLTFGMLMHAAGLFCTHFELRNGHVRVLGCCHLLCLLRPYHRPVHPHRRPLRSAPTASPALSTTSSQQCSSAPATSPTSSRQRSCICDAASMLWPCRFGTAVATALFCNGTKRAHPRAAPHGGCARGYLPAAF